MVVKIWLSSRRAGWLGLALLVGGFGGKAGAQTTTDLAGRWNNVHLSTPAQLTLLMTVHRVLGVDYPSLQHLNEQNLFSVETMTILVDAGGNFTGGASGTAVLDGAGLVRVSPAGGSPMLFSLNAAQDVMFTAKRDAGSSSQELELLLKAPASLAAAEMAGTWRLVMLGTPQSLIPRWTTNYSDPQNIVGGIHLLDGQDQFDVNSGTMTVDTDGAFTMVMGTELLAGTATPGSDGALNVSIPMPPNPTLHLTFYINQSKDVMAAVHTEQNYQEMIVAVKLPATTEVTEMKGLWRVANLETPGTLTYTLNGLGFISNIHQKNGFSIWTEKVHAGHTGVFTTPADLGVGTFAVQSPGVLLISGTNAMGDSWAQTMACNAGRNFMISVTGGENHMLDLVGRAPGENYQKAAGSSPVGEYGLIIAKPAAALAGAIQIHWASAPGRELQQSANLLDWTTVPGTEGLFTHTPAGAGTGAVFYRVRQPNP